MRRSRIDPSFSGRFLEVATHPARTFNVHVATIYRCLHDHPAL